MNFVPKYSLYWIALSLSACGGGSSNTTSTPSGGLMPLNPPATSTVVAVVPAASAPADTTAPTAPSGLTLARSTASTLSIRWTASTDNVSVTRYEIYIGPTLVASTNQTSIDLAGLSPNTAYAVNIKAFDDAENASAASGMFTASTASASPSVTVPVATTPSVTAPAGATAVADTTPPTAPSNLVASHVNSNSVTLSWGISTDNVAVVAYELLLNGNQVGSSTATTFTFANLTASTGYSLSVRAIDAAGNRSAESSPASASTVGPGVSISSVTGVASHGATLVIQGNGFGVKSPVEPYFYDNFEGQQVGQKLWGKSGSVGTALWKMYDGGANTDSFYVSDGYRGKAVQRVSPMNDFRDGYIDGLNSLEAYVSYRFRYTHTGNWQGSSGSVMKIFRLASLEGSNPIYSGQSSMLLTYQPKSDWLYSILSAGSQGSSQKTISGTLLAQENTWSRLEGYMRLSSPAGAANGEYFVGTLNSRAAEKNIITRAAGNNSLLNSFLLPFTSANGGNQPTDTLTQWADDVYFDRTQARVELCDQASWSSTIKRCEIQIPRTQWVDGSIQIQVNQGSLQIGQQAYLYVFDASGQSNTTGFPVTLAP